MELWNHGIIESWNHGIMESWNHGYSFRVPKRIMELGNYLGSMRESWNHGIGCIRGSMCPARGHSQIPMIRSLYPVSCMDSLWSVPSGISGEMIMCILRFFMVPAHWWACWGCHIYGRGLYWNWLRRRYHPRLTIPALVPGNEDQQSGTDRQPQVSLEFWASPESRFRC